MKLIKPNYQECLTNLTNSLLKYYHLDSYHESLEELDEILEKKDYKNIVLILYDGMGSKLLERNLTKDSFMNTHKVRDIYAVFPPTTTASTTSVLSGKNPNEHGWLGWDLYFSEIDRVVTMFHNTYKDTEQIVGKEDISKKTYPKESILEKIKTRVNTVGLFPFQETQYSTLEEMHNKILEICNNNKNNFIYAYYDNPDSTMHKTGTDSKQTLEVFQKINNSTEKLCKNLKDTLVIIIADHGHINSEKIILKDYEDIFDCLERDISIESRACSFKIKKHQKKKFQELFKKYFQNYFKLYTKDEVIKNKLFGEGKNNPHFEEVIGDFLAVAISNKYFVYDEKGKDFVSMHAGMTEDEMLVPFIIYQGETND